jgi:hypothetical protein
VYADQLESFLLLDIYYSKFEPKLVNKVYYIFCTELFSVRKVFKPNKKSDLIFKMKDTNIINKMCGHFFYLDKSAVKDAYTGFADEKGLLLNNMEDDYIALLEAQKALIKEGDRAAISLLSQKISHYAYALRLKKLAELDIEEDQKIFVPFMFDFRGRLYYTSSASLTFFTELRYCVHYGKYEKLESLQHPLLNKVNSIIKKYLPLLEKLSTFLNLKDRPDIIKIGAL